MHVKLYLFKFYVIFVGVCVCAHVQALEDAAPAKDRVRYVSSLSFPPRWELRRDLAQRYASMGVLGSAAQEFVELEMWEEAVDCYRQMQQVGVYVVRGTWLTPWTDKKNC